MTPRTQQPLSAAVQQIGARMARQWLYAEQQIVEWHDRQTRELHHLQWLLVRSMAPAPVGWWSHYPLAEVRNALELCSQRLSQLMKDLRETQEWLADNQEARLAMIQDCASLALDEHTARRRHYYMEEEHDNPEGHDFAEGDNEDDSGYVGTVIEIDTTTPLDEDWESQLAELDARIARLVKDVPAMSEPHNS